jgi:hypothetical protein
MDITIVSIFPQDISETKPGLVPDTYKIEKSDGKNPSILHINDVKSNLYIGDGRTFPITHTAEELANAIVNDFWTSMLQADESARPGLFWVPGKHSKADILTKFATELAEAKKRQNAWFMRLVRLADDDWEKTKQHRMISDLQRTAAHSLGLINKVWYHSPEPETYIKCPACATMVADSAAVCSNCNYVVNKARAIELGIKVA